MQNLQLTAADLRATQPDGQLSLTSLCSNVDLYASNLEVIQVFNVGRVVAVSVASLEHPESAAPHRVHVGPSIGQQLQSEDLQNAAVVCKPEAQEVEPQSWLYRLTCWSNVRTAPATPLWKPTISSIVLNLCHIPALTSGRANRRLDHVRLYRSLVLGYKKSNRLTRDLVFPSHTGSYMTNFNFPHLLAAHQTKCSSDC